MGTSFTLDALQRVFTYPFRDPRWKEKLAIAWALNLGAILIVPMLFFYGYLARMMRPVIRDGAEPSLPEWDDWSGMLKEGARLWGAAMIYSVPLLILMFGWFILMTVSLVVASQTGNSNTPWVVALAPLLSMASMGLLMILGFVWGALHPRSAAISWRRKSSPLPFGSKNGGRSGTRMRSALSWLISC